ncbi:hypothetical protein [Actinoplanes sp. NPDC051851]|uniref:hypothetical protein n=1 Tax=Actinoplanes sp. NPDC051851 TaxID=3154753 RepID=UPI0034354C62
MINDTGSIMSFALPAGLVHYGTGVPSVCVRHGETAVKHHKVTFISKPPGWAYLMILFGFLPYLIVVMSLRKTVQSPQWPFCARCLDLRRKQWIIGAALAIGVPVLMYALGQTALSSPALFFVGLFAFIIGMIVVARSAWGLMAGGVAARDGATVIFAKPHATFVTEATAAWQRAAEQYAAQQQQQVPAPYQQP